MKNNGKLLQICTLVLCAALLAFGVYSLKNANLTVGGTIGFKAHDCNILAYGKITGAVTDSDDMSGEEQELYLVNYDGTSEFSTEEAFNFTGSKELTFEHDLYSYDEGTLAAKNAPIIYFNDSGNVAPNIVITLYLKNNSDFPVSVSVGDISTPQGVTSSHSELTRLERNAPNFSELTITLSLTDNSSEIEATPGNLGIEINFNKTQEILNTPINLSVDTQNRSISFDPIEDASLYEIAIWEGGIDGDPINVQETTTCSNVELLYPFEENVNYYIKVRAVKGGSSEKAYSEYSINRSFGIYTPTSASNFTFKKNTDSENYTVTGYTGSDPVIVLPRTFAYASDGKTPIDGDTYVVDTVLSVTSFSLLPSLAKGGFKNYKGSIVMLDNITTIADSAFDGCSYITSVVIPNSVTSIGQKAFNGCSALQYIDFQADITTIKGNTFSDCKALQEITLPDTVQTIEGAFKNCSSLQSITIPESVQTFNYTISALSASGAFNGCSNLQNVYYKGNVQQWCSIDFQYDLSSGILGFQSFSIIHNPCHYGASLYVNGNQKLTLIDCSELSTIPDGVFYGCSSIKALKIYGEIPTLGKEVFTNCKNLKSVYFEGSLQEWCNLDFSSAQYNPCNYGLDLYVVNSKEYEKVTKLNLERFESIKSYAFYGCSSITDVIIPESLTNIGSGAFTNCKNLKNIHYASDIVHWCNILFGNTGANPCSLGANLYINGNQKVTELNLEGCTSIGSYSFSGCISITEVMIPQSVTSIGSDAFSDCKNIKYVYYGADISNWCNIDFRSGSSNPCSLGANLYINSDQKVTELNLDSCSSIGSYAFYGCKFITQVTIPATVATVSSYAFENCTSLTKIIISEGVSSIGSYVFYGCTAAKEITIPESLISIGTMAFSHCEDIKNVYYASDISHWCGINFNSTRSNPCSYGANLYINGDQKVTKLNLEGCTSIKDYAFYGFISITDVTIPESVMSVGVSAFNGCTSLTNVIILANLTNIASHVFDNCSQLQSIVLPSSVTKIENGAFYYCNALLKIYYTGDAAQFEVLKADTKTTSDNTKFTSATPYFQVADAESVPEETGNYWYYDNNNNIVEVIK